VDVPASDYVDVRPGAVAGEAPEPDDEERLRRDRPPHWDQ
jgi:hypothetical protein